MSQHYLEQYSLHNSVTSSAITPEDPNGIWEVLTSVDLTCSGTAHYDLWMVGTAWSVNTDTEDK